MIMMREYDMLIAVEPGSVNYRLDSLVHTNPHSKASKMNTSTLPDKVSEDDLM